MVTLDHILEARKQMIEARETHLDALAYRLENPQIRSVMETLMTGEPDPLMAQGEAFRLCLDLGLVTIEKGTPGVANPIYREVIAREITFGTQMAIPEPEWKWQKPDGTLDMDALLKEFQAFWQTNSEIWETKLNYPEAFPHLLLMAFLQRVADGHRGAMDGAEKKQEVCDSKLQVQNRQGGRFCYEYAAGRGRMDLAVEFNGAWNIIEIKLLRQGKTFEALKEEGIRQTLRYRDSFSPALRSADGHPVQCYLVIFDRRSEKPSWDERIKWIAGPPGITVVCC